MKVESFECSEVASEPIEACEEAVGLIEELGLDGQRDLLAPKEEDEADRRCPYRRITKDEDFTYRTLCPEETELKNYRSSPIPLRVLQIAKHAESLGMFSKLCVWDRESAAIPDPVLVAYTNEDKSWERKVYILARWGEELETFSTLLKQALKIRREAMSQQLAEIKEAVASEISRLKGVSNQKLIQLGANSDYSFYTRF